MILSDREIRKRLITEEEKKELWKNKNWAEIDGKILICGFEEDKLEVNTYTLSVGEQYISLRDPDKVHSVTAIRIEPGETVFILTKEYIGLPKNITGLIVPKARWIFEGLVINATRVDPTWHGKLKIAVTNITKNPITISKGEGLCCMYFIETFEVEKELDKYISPSLGREELEPLKTPHHRAEDLLPPDKVTLDDLEKVVRIYGKPWDIVRGVVSLAKDEVTKYIDYEKAPNIVDEAKKQAYEEAFKEMLSWQKYLMKSLVGLVITIIVAIVLAVLKMFLS